MKVRYTNIEGQIVAEERNGVRRSYVPDVLGSTILLLNNNQGIDDAVSYAPFGEVQERTGATPTRFLWAGTRGYDSGGPLTYVRARSLSEKLGRWTTVDPMGISQPPYAYVHNRPVSATDSSGMAPAVARRVPCETLLKYRAPAPNPEEIRKCLIAFAKDKNAGKLAQCLGGPKAQVEKDAMIAFVCCSSFNPGGTDCAPASGNFTLKECCQMEMCKCVLGNSKDALTKFADRVYPGMDRIIWHDCACKADSDCSNAIDQMFK